jgi:hypothetical protein
MPHAGMQHATSPTTLAAARAAEVKSQGTRANLEVAFGEDPTCNKALDPTSGHRTSLFLAGLLAACCKTPEGGSSSYCGSSWL